MSVSNPLFWAAARRQRRQNRAIESRGHSKRPHAEAGHPTERLGDRRQPHPNQRCLPCSSVVADAPGRISSDVPAARQIDGSYPNTASLWRQKACLARRCLDLRSQSEESAPISRTHEDAEWHFAQEFSRLRVCGRIVEGCTKLAEVLRCKENEP